MIFFPNAKINIGLKIRKRRSDGFHDIETFFYPVRIFDICEFIESNQNKTTLTISGRKIDCPPEKNLVYKAYQILCESYNLPPLKIHLHKNIPDGAGLGGGSSDASFMLLNISKYFGLDVPIPKLKKIATSLGSDCPFFIENNPSIGYGRGEITEPVDINLSGYYFYIVFPGINIRTKEAYSNVQPTIPDNPIKSIVKEPIANWRNLLTNDFEEHIFKKYPMLKRIKDLLYENGAVYAAMSGSGSTMYGIFNKQVPDISEFGSYMKWIVKA